MIPVILFIIIGIQFEYTDFWYWFYVIFDGIIMTINIIKKVFEK